MMKERMNFETKEQNFHAQKIYRISKFFISSASIKSNIY